MAGRCFQIPLRLFLPSVADIQGEGARVNYLKWKIVSLCRNFPGGTEHAATRFARNGKWNASLRDLCAIRGDGS